MSVRFGSIVPTIRQHLLCDKDTSAVWNRPRKKKSLIFYLRKTLERLQYSYITYLQRGKNGQIQTARNKYPEIISWSRDHMLHDREVPGNCCANSAKLYIHLKKKKPRK